MTVIACASGCHACSVAAGWVMLAGAAWWIVSYGRYFLRERRRNARAVQGEVDAN